MIIENYKIHKELSQKGILGINQRNADYVLRYNPRKLFPRVDNKLVTKQLAIDSNIPVPELYHTIEIERQIKSLGNFLDPYSDFVIKPARGSGGDGIIVICDRKKSLYRTISGEALTEDDLKHHISNILSGLYSLGGQEDKAMIEYRVKFDPLFDSVSYQGVPDIRLIVFLGFPVMAMMRLPTRLSNGKANLHQGAIGVGIDIATGKTFNGVWHNKIINEHPDTMESILNLTIPNWENILLLASQCYEITGLGYLGVDVVLDKDRGPLLLELNARPGLNIQIANDRGLLPRLHNIELKKNDLGFDQRVSYVKENFGIL